MRKMKAVRGKRGPGPQGFLVHFSSEEGEAHSLREHRDQWAVMVATAGCGPARTVQPRGDASASHESIAGISGAPAVMHPWRLHGRMALRVAWTEPESRPEVPAQPRFPSRTEPGAKQT